MPKKVPMKRALSALAVLAVLVPFAWFLVYAGGDSRIAGSETIYVFDLEAGTYEVGSVLDGVPAEGDAYAWAKLFSCGACEPAQRYVGYIERFSGDLRNRLAQARTHGMVQSILATTQWRNPKDYEVRDPEAEAWVPITSDEGREITQKARRCEEGRPARECRP